ncbi:hypothetical protein GCM10022284_68210 [Streptomyces hundungensis]
MTVGVGDSAAMNWTEIREYVSAAAQALGDAGIVPGERWDEAGGTALYWSKGDPALGSGPWAYGLLVFWGARGGRQGWGCAPLDAAGDPALDAVTWLPVTRILAPALLAAHVQRLLAEGAPSGGAER